MFNYGLPKFMYDADKGTDLGGNGESEVQDNGTETKDAETNEQPLTLEQVQKMIQSETDKVRGEYSKKLKEKDKAFEELRVASMTEEQKKEDALRKEREELEKLRAETTLTKLTLETVDLLKENNLPLDAKDFLIGKDAESTKANVESFKKMFSSALEQAVTERFKQSGKEHVEGNTAKGRYTADDIAKMTTDEINANWEKIQRDLQK